MPPLILDTNPIENLWLFVKVKLYEDGKQYNNKADQWEAIKRTMSEIEPAKLKKKLQKQRVIDNWWLL